jgi:hypothetical protein
MTLDDIKIISYNRTTAKRFGYWVRIKDYRKLDNRMARKGFIRFIESSLGPLGERWQYTKYNNGTFEIKFDDERDLLIFLLKAKRD